MDITHGRIVNVYRLLLNIAIESALIYLPSNPVVIFHVFLYVYQRVTGYHVFVVSSFKKKRCLVRCCLKSSPESPHSGSATK